MENIIAVSINLTLIGSNVYKLVKKDQVHLDIYKPDDFSYGNVGNILA